MEKFKTKLKRSELATVAGLLEYYLKVSEPGDYSKALLDCLIRDIVTAFNARLAEYQKQEFKVTWNKTIVYTLIVFFNDLLAHFEVTEYWVAVIHNLRNQMIQKFPLPKPAVYAQ